MLKRRNILLPCISIRGSVCPLVSRPVYQFFFSLKSLFKDFLQWIFGKQLTTYSSIPGAATVSITGYYDLPHGYFCSYQVIPIMKSCKAHLLRFPSTASREAVDHLLQHTWRCYIHHQRISRSSPWLFAFIPRHTKNKKVV